MDGMEWNGLHVNGTQCVLSDFPTVFARPQQEVPLQDKKLLKIGIAVLSKILYLDLQYFRMFFNVTCLYEAHAFLIFCSFFTTLHCTVYM